MEKINIAELLQDCPKGMELDCLLFKDAPVYFNRITNSFCYPIEIKVEHPDGSFEKFELSKEGCIYDRVIAKCVIFPKGKTTWEGFVPPCKFKDGDILSYQYKGFKNRTIYIYMQHSRMNTTYYVALSGNSDSEFMVNDKEGHALNSYNDSVRLATEEEKEKLFQAIKDNGYKWNAETKTLEKLQRFKVGDRVKHISACTPGIVVKVTDKGYHIDYPKGEGVCYVNFTLEKDYELVLNKFDITTLKPFDKVLVRGSDNGMWCASIFSHTWKDKYFCVDTWHNQCIPYEANKELLGTTNDCDEYYKTW